MTQGRVYVAGTFDTKARELDYLAERLRAAGVAVCTVDLSTLPGEHGAEIGSAQVAASRPPGAAAVFSGERGSAVTAMAQAFIAFICAQRDVAGVVGAGGSGATALVTPALQALPVGLPKLMVSTVASGDTRGYVGASDIFMLYPVTDVSGLNSISARVLANAAHAMAGMVLHSAPAPASGRAAVGLTMFGVTTPCVQAVAAALEARWEPIVFHATGSGGQSMEKLVASGLLAAVLDLTTTEIADELVGGVLSAGPERLDAIAASGLPYLGSVGALDMVNFRALHTVPPQFGARRLHAHNAEVTLMRTTPEENARMGRWIAAKLNRFRGPVRFLLPLGGVSALDAPGQAFWDLDADKALFDALRGAFATSDAHRLVDVSAHINDPAFAAEVLRHFGEITA